MFCNQRFEGFIHTLSPDLLIGGVGKFPEFAFFISVRGKWLIAKVFLPYGRGYPHSYPVIAVDKPVPRPYSSCSSASISAWASSQASSTSARRELTSP